MLRLPNEVELADLPHDWKCPAIGTPAEVRQKFEKAFPGEQHEDCQTYVVGEMFWIEFNYRVDNKSGLVESIGVRSNAGVGAIDMMKRACEVLGLRMVDCQTMEIADFSDRSEASMEQFTAWRDRAIGKTDGWEK